MLERGLLILSIARLRMVLKVGLRTDKARDAQLDSAIVQSHFVTLTQFCCELRAVNNE